MEIGGHEFSELYTDLEKVPEYDIGVYVVVCLVESNPHCVLYIGTSEGGTGRGDGADVTETGNLQATLRNHKKRECWKDTTHGEVGYFVTSELDPDRRIPLRDELNWKYITPCGTDIWDGPGDADEAPFRERFGPRGKASI